MCCIIYKPAGQPLPSDKILTTIARINHDGFGLVTENRYFRSLDFEHFMAVLHEVRDDEECIIHMRWATHGSVALYNCHPFKIGDVYFAHNGVLPYQPINDTTDSEFAFRYKIMPVVKKHGYMSHKVDEVVGQIIGTSRFAMMHRGKVRLFGDYTVIDGIYYSNTRWLNYLNSAHLASRAL
jgi:hypothetical protein